MKGIVGGGACLKAMWAWPNPPLKSMGGGRKGIMGMGRGLISTEMKGRNERDCGKGLWPNVNGNGGMKGIVGRGAWFKAL